MVHDDDIGLRRLASRLEQKALAVERALRSLTQVRLGGNLVPQLWPRRGREIAERAVFRALGPRLDRVELLLHSILEQRVPRRSRELQTDEAEIIAPPFEQREAHLLIVERALEERKVLSDELLLQVDGVRRHHGALAIGRGPAKRGDEVAERFTDTCAGFQQTYAAVVVQPRDLHCHRALAGPVLVARMLRRDPALGPEIAV